MGETFCTRDEKICVCVCVCNEYTRTYVVKKVQLKKYLSHISHKNESRDDYRTYVSHTTLHSSFILHSRHTLLIHTVYYLEQKFIISFFNTYSNNYTRVHIKPPFTSHHLSLKLEKYVLLLLKQIYLNQPSYQFHQIIKRNISTFPLSKNFPFYHEIVQEVIIHF